MGNKLQKIGLESPESVIADDIIYNLKDDIKCLYMVAEIKREIKPLSKDQYEFWDRVHTIVLKRFGINREK
jgi:hypothetical protein